MQKRSKTVRFKKCEIKHSNAVCLKNKLTYLDLFLVNGLHILLSSWPTVKAECDFATALVSNTLSCKSKICYTIEGLCDPATVNMIMTHFDWVIIIFSVISSLYAPFPCRPLL